MTAPHSRRSAARDRRVDLGNGLAAALCIVLALGAGLLVGDRRAASPGALPAITAPGTAGAVDVVTLPGGAGAGVVDGAGRVVPIAGYHRILSGNTLTDWALVELCEPGRILAVTELSASQAPWRHRFAGLATIATLGNLEDVVARAPDLVLASGLGDPRYLARLREAGMAVFDVGRATGASSVLATLRRLGVLLGHGDRAEILARRWQRSLTSIARDVPAAGRPRAIYVSAYGGKLYGGTTGSAYHDILVHAGLVDAAAARYRDFPEYVAEEILALDPDLLVSRIGQTQVLCSAPGLAELRACRVPGGVVELDAFLLDDPGLGILEAAEALHRAVYTPRAEAPDANPRTR